MSRFCSALTRLNSSRLKHSSAQSSTALCSASSRLRHGGVRPDLAELVVERLVGHDQLAQPAQQRIAGARVQRRERTHRHPLDQHLHADELLVDDVGLHQLVEQRAERVADREDLAAEARLHVVAEGVHVARFLARLVGGVLLRARDRRTCRTGWSTGCSAPCSPCRMFDSVQRALSLASVDLLAARRAGRPPRCAAPATDAERNHRLVGRPRFVPVGCSRGSSGFQKCSSVRAMISSKWACAGRSARRRSWPRNRCGLRCCTRGQSCGWSRCGSQQARATLRLKRTPGSSTSFLTLSTLAERLLT